MHEMSLTRSMVGIIEGQAALHDFQSVKKIRLEIGALSCVDPEALTFCFDAATRDTVAEGATLVISTVPGQAWCRDCDMAVPIGERGEPCPKCGDYRLQIRAGDEIRIKDLEVN